MPQLLPGDRPSESSRRFLRHGLSAATLLGVGILVLVFAQTGGAAPASVTGYHEGCSDPTVTKTLAPALMAAEFNASKPKTVTVTRTKTKTVTTTRTATKVLCLTKTETQPGQTTTVATTLTATQPPETTTTTVTRTLDPATLTTTTTVTVTTGDTTTGDTTITTTSTKDTTTEETTTGDTTSSSTTTEETTTGSTTPGGWRWRRWWWWRLLEGLLAPSASRRGRLCQVAGPALRAACSILER